MGDRIIKFERSIIPAMDIEDPAKARKLARAMKTVPKIGAFKVGFLLGFDGLAKMVDSIKRNHGDDIPVIYDHQKAGNDIPDMGAPFARKLVRAGVDAAIIFPFTGPETQKAWTKSVQDAGMKVITGGMMTHPKFLRSEGGYIADDAPERIYQLACELGVRHFVVPGNKLDWVEKIRAILDEELGVGNYELYAPGFINQGGSITECAKVAGPFWHAIVGGAIYNKPDFQAMRQAANICASALA